jgi:Family of unknown function (DUF5678)
MSVETLDAIKKQTAGLTKPEKFVLANYLLEQSKEKPEMENGNNILDDDVKHRQLEWLKDNREKYAGQYVALDGDRLVGHGATIREANEQAKQNGAKSAFLVRVFSEETTVSAGL